MVFCIDIGLAALPDLLQDIVPIPAHHLLASADTRIPAPALILGAAAVLGPDHILGLPLTGFLAGTLFMGENCCASVSFYFFIYVFYFILYQCHFLAGGTIKKGVLELHNVYVLRSLIFAFLILHTQQLTFT